MNAHERTRRPLPARRRQTREPVCWGLVLGFGGGLLGDILLGEVPSWVAQGALDGALLAFASLAAFSLGYLATLSRTAEAKDGRARYDEGENA